MTSVSSLRKAPRREQGATRAVSAASTRARLVMLFDPGTVTVARGGRVTGSMASFSGYAAASLIRHPHQEQPRRRRRRPGLGPVLGLQDLGDLRLGPVAAADVHQRAGDG